MAAVLEREGATHPTLRKAVCRAAAGATDLTQADSIPAELQRYLEKVSRFAYKILDRDVAALKAEGYSEDAVFELTVSGAVGAGLGRLERGLTVLGQSARAKELADALE